MVADSGDVLNCGTHVIFGLIDALACSGNRFFDPTDRYLLINLTVSVVRWATINSTRETVFWTSVTQRAAIDSASARAVLEGRVENASEHTNVNIPKRFIAFLFKET